MKNRTGQTPPQAAHVAAATFLILILTAFAAPVVATSTASATPGTVAAQDGRLLLEPSPELRELVERSGTAMDDTDITHVTDALRRVTLNYEGERPLRVRSLVLFYRDGRVVDRAQGPEPVSLEPGGRTTPTTAWLPLRDIERWLGESDGRLAPTGLPRVDEIEMPTTFDFDPPADSVGFAQGGGGIFVAVIASNEDSAGHMIKIYVLPTLRPLAIEFTGLE